MVVNQNPLLMLPARLQRMKKAHRFSECQEAMTPATILAQEPLFCHQDKTHVSFTPLACVPKNSNLFLRMSSVSHRTGLSQVVTTPTPRTKSCAVTGGSLGSQNTKIRGTNRFSVRSMAIHRSLQCPTTKTVFLCLGYLS